jgi:2-methylcitrate dehydratase PrpD
MADIKYGSPDGIDALCENTVSATYGQLSDDNIRIFKDRLLDITGCILGGSIVKEDAFFVEYLKGIGGKEEASVFTKEWKLPLASAAQINCLYARANDFGAMFFHVFDEHIASHDSETLIPLGLTISSMKKVTGKEFIVNDIAAEDLTARILYSLPVRWPTDMLLVSTAAAALVSRYYGFDAKRLKIALSFGAANCTDPLNSYYDYSQDFKYHNAESARMGIMAAEMAKGGWTGFRDPYFGHWGLVSKQVKDGGLPSLYQNCFLDLGKKFFTEESFKRCPGGIPTTAAANCGKDIRFQILKADGTFDAKKIKKVHVLRSDKVRYNYYSEPFVMRNHMNALFCYQFSCCCALYHGAVSVEQVQTDAILKEPELIRIAEESTFEVFPDAKPLLKAVVEMSDGREFTSIQDYASSMHAYPSREFLEDKFRSQFFACGKLKKPVADKIIKMAGRIEDISDMREFTELLTT